MSFFSGIQNQYTIPVIFKSHRPSKKQRKQTSVCSWCKLCILAVYSRCLFSLSGCSQVYPYITGTRTAQDKHWTSLGVYRPKAPLQWEITQATYTQCGRFAHVSMVTRPESLISREVCLFAKAGSQSCSACSSGHSMAQVGRLTYKCTHIPPTHHS